jgi:hypothetical protein
MPKFVAALRNPKEPVNLRGHLSQEEEEVEVQVEVGEEGELQVEWAITKFWGFEAIWFAGIRALPYGSKANYRTLPI